MGAPPSNPRFNDVAAELLSQAGGSALVRVRGDSMMPTLRDGEVVSIDFSRRKPRFGELVLFRQSDYFAIHRLVGWGRREDGSVYLRTRGDGRIGLDPPVERESVLGLAVALQRGQTWWDLTGPLARGFGRAVALHDLCWASVAVGGRGLGPGVPRALERVDRLLLRVAHAVGFRLTHRPCSRALL